MRACKHKCTSTPKNQANENPTGYYILDLSTSLPGPSSPTLLASLSLSFPLSPSIAPSRSRSRAPTLSPYNYHYDYNVLGLAGPKDGDGDWSRGQADSDANDAARRVLRIDGLHYLCVRASSCYCLCVRARASLLSKYLQEDICENSLGCSSIMRAIEQKLFANRRCQRLVRGIFSTHPRWGDLSQTKNSLVYRTAFHVFRGTMRQGVILALQQVARKNPYLVHRLTTTHSPPPPSSSKYFDRVCCGDHP